MRQFLSSHVQNENKDLDDLQDGETAANEVHIMILGCDEAIKKHEAKSQTVVSMTYYYFGISEMEHHITMGSLFRLTDMLVYYDNNNWCLDGRIISLSLETFFQPYQQQGKKILCCISYVEEKFNFS